MDDKQQIWIRSDEHPDDTTSSSDQVAVIQELTVFPYKIPYRTTLKPKFTYQNKGYAIYNLTDREKLWSNLRATHSPLISHGNTKSCAKLRESGSNAQATHVELIIFGCVYCR